MFITKKKLKACIDDIKEANRVEKLIGTHYSDETDEHYETRKLYCRGYEDGTDDMYNTICSRLKINR